MTLEYDCYMNTQTPIDLFDLMSRWDIEAKEIPAFILRQGANLSDTDRKNLMARRVVLRRVVEELRDAMHYMTAEYRGLVDGVVTVYAETEDDCWRVVGDAGTVEFKLCTSWEPTDNAIAHSKKKKK